VDRGKKIIIFDPGVFSLADSERDYYIGCPYRYWFYKALALWYFIEDVCFNPKAKYALDLYANQEQNDQLYYSTLFY
jgi:hypothetical protein